MNLFQGAAKLPGKHRPSALAALAHLHCGRYYTAGIMWWRLICQRPQEPEAWGGLLVCAHCAGKEGLARRAKLKLASLPPRDQRRAILARLWHHAATARAYHAASRPSPDTAPPVSLLQSILRSAAGTLAHAAHQFDRRADVHHHRAVCESALGNLNTANGSLKRALAVNPNYAYAPRLFSHLARDAASAVNRDNS